VVKTLENTALSAPVISLSNLRVLNIRKVGIRNRYKERERPDECVRASGLGEYSCDAACDNCHCATY
jgi:hypothetical protein